MSEEQEYIEITAENWEQFVGREAEFSSGGTYLTCTFFGYVEHNPTKKYASRSYLWECARIAKPKEKVFRVSPDHREIFEALSKGALVHEKGNILNKWCSGWYIDGDQILLTPDYTRPLADQEWIRMEVSE